MKRRIISAILAVVASMTASLASAQVYSGTITESDYVVGAETWAPTIEYTITYQSDKHLVVDCTLSEYKTGAVIKVNFEDKGTFEQMSMVDGNNLHYTITSASTYEEGTEMNNAFFYMEYPSAASRANFKYTVGESNTTDTDVPVWDSDPTVKVTSTTAKITAIARDESTTPLTFEVCDDSDFPDESTVTATGYSEKETTITLKGLTPSTNYRYHIRVKDASGNMSITKVLEFKTSATPTIVATYYGVFYSSEWEEVANNFTPKLNWKAETYSGYDEVVITARLDEELPEGATIKFCGYIEGGIGAIEGEMEATGNTNEYSINVSELIGSKTLAQDQIFGQLYFLINTSDGKSRTKILAAQYKVGASNDPIDEDTKAPEFNQYPEAKNVTDRSVDLVFNVYDDSGKALLTITGDNDFVTISKQITATSGEQTITVTGLKASTTYNLVFALEDLAGNKCEKTMPLEFTTEAEQDLDVLYTRIWFKTENWTKHNDNNTFAPDGNILIAVNKDNTITATVTVASDGDLIDNAQFILHGVESPSFTQTSTNVFTATTTNAIADRSKQLAFHLNYVLKDGKGNSELAVQFFTPDQGSTSAVSTVNADSAKVIATNGTISVEGGKEFAVYTLTGQKVYSGTAAATLARGVYVVVTEGKATKVVL